MKNTGSSDTSTTKPFVIQSFGIGSAGLNHSTKEPSGPQQSMLTTSPRMAARQRSPISKGASEVMTAPLRRPQMQRKVGSSMRPFSQTSWCIAQARLLMTTPPPKWNFTPISNDQIIRAIDNMLPYKATAPDTVPNCILKEAKNLLVPYLGPIFQATFNLGYYPEHWAQTLTVVLKKPGKSDYGTPNAWRPISLSDGFARLLNSCITNELTNRCALHNILPANHFGARPGHSTMQAVHYFVTKVKNAWRGKKVASALFLDVKGAFPSVDIKQLLHDMRNRGIPVQYTDWIVRQMRNWRTQLNFDNYTSEPFSIENGLDRGDPLSPIGYMIYNSDILDIPATKNSEDAILFVDDTMLLAIGKDYKEMHRTLTNMLHRDNGVLRWADAHNCTFGIEKFQLVDFL
jgi:hypothetical protein